MRIQKQALGEADPAGSSATTLNESRVELYYQRGEYSRSEPLLRRSLAMREKALGKDHPEVATSLDLAVRCWNWKTGVSPEPLYRRALAISGSALGPDHPRLALGLGNLAAFYVTDGRTKESCGCSDVF